MSDPTAPYDAPRPAPRPLSPSDEKMWATLIHLGGIFFYVVSPLVGYLVLKDRGPFIRAHTTAALNFQLTVLIAYAISGALTAIFIGYLMLPVVWILALIFSIMAGLAANRGQFYTYPLAIRFIS